MPIQFKPDKYNVIVTHRYTSQTGRWIIFLGTHYDGHLQCWDVGQFQTLTGACQRIHFKENKTGATIEYDELKEKLQGLKPHEEPTDKFHIFGPDGKDYVC